MQLCDSTAIIFFHIHAATTTDASITNATTTIQHLHPTVKRHVMLTLLNSTGSIRKAIFPASLIITAAYQCFTTHCLTPVPLSSCTSRKCLAFGIPWAPTAALRFDRATLAFPTAHYFALLYLITLHGAALCLAVHHYLTARSHAASPPAHVSRSFPLHVSKLAPPYWSPPQHPHPQ